LDRELIPNFVIAALNLIYQPEWTRIMATGAAEQESTVGASAGLMAQIRPGILLGGEARYLRKYEGIGLDELAGQALYVGPTAYFQIDQMQMTRFNGEHGTLFGHPARADLTWIKR
jgi:hypothetical protein